ncbi:MAG: cold shock domain-containing protein [Acidobacteriota bacterium]
MNGTVKRVVTDRGFGFIATDSGEEYFFHRDQLLSGLDFDTLRQGDRVTFEKQAGPKGPRAVAVQRA